MLRRIARYFFIVFGLVVLWASTSRNAMKYLTDARDNNSWWGIYQCLNGDLVSMAYLDFVDRFIEANPRTFNHPSFSGERKTILYMDGDSFTWHLHDSDIIGLDSFCYFQRNHGLKYHLDTSKRNVLVIEVSERYLQSYFTGLQMFNEVLDTSARKRDVAGIYLTSINSSYTASLLPSVSADDFFNKYINQNLQCNLFNYNFIMPMFETKAALNYYIFNRASGDVVISNDRNFLFFRETVSKTDMGSSYYPVSTADAAHIVDVLNGIYEHYKVAGFAEVYFSVIPNSATIMQPEGYNQLIPMVQNDTRLRMKLIDAYSVFKQSHDVYYLPGDTHWNHKGKQLWLDMLNARLVRDSLVQ